MPAAARYLATAAPPEAWARFQRRDVDDRKLDERRTHRAGAEAAGARIEGYDTPTSSPDTTRSSA